MIRVGFLQDPDRGNASDRRYALRELRRIVEPADVVETWAAESEADLVDAPELDVLVVDYGALHSAYGDAVERWGRSVRRWADEHPSRLVVLWTAFTAACYRAVFDDLRDSANVVARYRDAWDFAGAPDADERIASWLVRDRRSGLDSRAV